MTTCTTCSPGTLLARLRTRRHEPIRCFQRNPPTVHCLRPALPPVVWPTILLRRGCTTRPPCACCGAECRPAHRINMWVVHMHVLGPLHCLVLGRFTRPRPHHAVGDLFLRPSTRVRRRAAARNAARVTFPCPAHAAGRRVRRLFPRSLALPAASPPGASPQLSG